MYEPDRFLDVGGVTLAVDDRGGGDATPLVLVHGFTGGRIDYADVIDDLAADRRVVAWDHRGHSDSTNTGEQADYTFDALVADAVAALDALDLDRFHLLGHSMGGIVAQRLVLEHPERIASLILMDTLAEAASTIPEEWVEMFTTMGREQGMTIVAEVMESVAAAQMVAPEEARPRILARNRHKLGSMDPEAFAGLAAELRSFEPLLDRLSSVGCPTTVIVGEFDLPLRGQADAIAATIHGARLEVVDGAAHSPQEERTEAWLTVVRGHLARAGA